MKLKIAPEATDAKPNVPAMLRAARFAIFGKRTAKPLKAFDPQELSEEGEESPTRSSDAKSIQS